MDPGGGELRGPLAVQTSVFYPGYGFRLDSFPWPWGFAPKQNGTQSTNQSIEAQMYLSPFVLCVRCAYVFLLLSLLG
jgi:hypothetical protein